MEVKEKSMLTLEEKVDALLTNQSIIMKKLEKIDHETDYDYVKQGLTNVIADIIAEMIGYRGKIGGGTA